LSIPVLKWINARVIAIHPGDGQHPYLTTTRPSSTCVKVWTGNHKVVAVTGPAAARDNDLVGLGEDEFAMLADQIVANPMLNGETIRLDGALRMAPR
jgi:hypothetical protein